MKSKKSNMKNEIILTSDELLRGGDCNLFKIQNALWYKNDNVGKIQKEEGKFSFTKKSIVKDVIFENGKVNLSLNMTIKELKDFVKYVENRNKKMTKMFKKGTSYLTNLNNEITLVLKA